MHAARRHERLEEHGAAVAEILQRRFLAVDWFRDELAATTGVDVYREPFDRDRGWHVYDGAPARVLLTRFEDLERVGADALRSFFAVAREPTIPRRNVGLGDDDRSLYHRFLAEGRLPADLVDAVYTTPLARHFYTDEERAAFAERWLAVSR